MHFCMTTALNSMRVGMRESISSDVDAAETQNKGR